MADLGEGHGGHWLQPFPQKIVLADLD